MQIETDTLALKLSSLTCLIDWLHKEGAQFTPALRLSAPQASWALRRGPFVGALGVGLMVLLS
jgi:hypothetical protein